jgi:hypothetical protein
MRYSGTTSKLTGWLAGQVVNRPSVQAGICLLILLLGFLTNRASTKPLPPGTPTAAVVPSPTIAATSTGYALRYCPVNRPVAELFNSMKRLHLPGSRWQRAGFSRGEIRFEADSRPVLESLLEEMKARDLPLPGAIVLHGRVTDIVGRPIANAQVDLVGNWYRINCDQTRADGSFSMFLTDPVPPPQIRCQLRVRIANSKGRFFSRSLTLNTGAATGVLVSRTVFEQFNLFYWIAALAIAGFLFHDARRLIRKFRRCPGTCTTCGYDLRGTVSDRCSECGMVIPPQVRAELGTPSVQPCGHQSSNEIA